MHRHGGRRPQSAPNAWAASSLRAAWDLRLATTSPRLLPDRPPKETGHDIRRRAFNLHTRGQIGKELPADAPTGSAQAMASALTVVIPNGAKLSRVAATEPSTSMPRQASSITTTAKPSRRASSAE